MSWFAQFESRPARFESLTNQRTQGPLDGGVSNGIWARPSRFVLFETSPCFSGLSRFVRRFSLFVLFPSFSAFFDSTYEEQSRKGHGCLEHLLAIREAGYFRSGGRVNRAWRGKRGETWGRKGGRKGARKHTRRTLIFVLLWFRYSLVTFQYLNVWRYMLNIPLRDVGGGGVEDLFW